MLKWLANLIVYSGLLLLLAPSTAAQSHPVVQSIASLNHRDATIVSKSEDRVVLAANGMQHGVELLVGERAAEYLRAIKAQHPGRFQETGKYLSGLGFLPTEEVMVARLLRFFPVENEDAPSDSGVRWAYSGSTSEGEIIMHSWDDGSDATWEGSVYVQEYSDGAWTTSEGQIDIETADYQVVWAEGVDGGGPGGGDPFPASLDETMGALRQFSFASFTVTSSLPGDYRLCVYPYVMHPWWQDWMGCFTAGAAGCAAACAFTGPGWAKCTGACAIGVQVACAVEMLVR